MYGMKRKCLSNFFPPKSSHGHVSIDFSKGVSILYWQCGVLLFYLELQLDSRTCFRIWQQATEN